VRRLTVADEARDVSDPDRRLLVQQRRRRREPARAQILLEGAHAEALVRSLDLPRRRAERARQHRERQPPAVMACDESARG